MHTHRLIVKIVLYVIFGAIGLPLFGQLSLAQNASNQIRPISVTNTVSIFDLESPKALKNKKTNQVLSDFNLLSLKTEQLVNLIISDAESINLDIPIGDDVKVAKLSKVNIFTPNFKVRKASDPTQSLDIDLGINYQGKIDGDEASLVTLNFRGKEVVGIISVDGKTYNLGKLKDENFHIIYKETDLDYTNNFTCHTEDGQKIGTNKIDNKISKNSVVDNCVSVYIETQFDVYQDKGSVTGVTNFITSLFAQVATIYAEESVNLLLSEILVWDINDPYSGNNPTSLLNEFSDRLNGNFNGDIAHLINFEQNGGIAYVDALCSPFAYGTSGIDDYFSNVPTYSWSVGILAHEIGHNLGSPHTHACVWNGNNTSLDACDPSGEECGGTIPNAGTIMSYCHLLNNVGIDFSLGFGKQPGDLIRSTVNAASCLAVCGDCEDKGQPCNDNDPCTINDEINAACSCVGEYTDVDLDGVCAQEDPDDLDPCTPNACPTCTNLTITVVLDKRPAETSWEIRGESGNVLITSGSGYGNFAKGTTVRSRLCVSDACYTFVMKDKYGDGLCCGQGEGSYKVTRDDTGEVLFSGGEFDKEDINDFCISSDTNNCTGPCDDKDDCTINDEYDNNCDCIGTPKRDTDNDGICDDRDDCPDLKNNLIGARCNDGDPCTDDEIYTSNCNCESSQGTVDRDGDGVCAVLDPDDNDPCTPTSCGECIDVVVRLTLDKYPGETAWAITNSAGQVVLESPRYFSQDRGNTRDISICLSPGCYDFDITDTYGDGICCRQGDGGYMISMSNGQVLIEGGEFSRSEKKQFCVNGDAAECSGRCDDNDPCTVNDRYDDDCNCKGTPLADSDNDGICDREDECPDLSNDLFGRRCDDGDPCTTGERYAEANCDCSGGTVTDQDDDGVCAAEDPDDNDSCNPDNTGSDCSGNLGCTMVSLTDFEAGLDGWQVGQADASRARFSQYANSGEYCIRLRDNTDQSVLTSKRLAMAQASQINVEFSYLPLSMDNSSEDFWLQLSTDGGRTFTTVEEWNKNDEFRNNIRYTGTANIEGPFTNNTHLRFRCDASNNADIVFIDDIKVEQCNESSANLGISHSKEIAPNKLEYYLDFKIFPNPVAQTQDLKVEITSLSDQSRLTIFDILGKEIMAKTVKKQNYYNTTINTSSLESGTYLIKVESDNNYKIRKVMIIH